jgi:hypothetical protein
VLVGIVFGLAEVLAIFLMRPMGGDDTAWQSFLAVQVSLVPAGLLAIAGCIAAAEFIRLGLDIQNNTHAAAHFSEQAAQVSRAR